VPGPTDVTLRRISLLRLYRQDPAQPDPVARSAIDAHWQYLTASQPHLFDGPLVAGTNVTTHPDSGEVTVSWGVTTYRHYLARHAPQPLPYARALYTAVLQPTDDGRLAIGQMNTTTADPGRLQLPGGGIDPPPEGMNVDPLGLSAEARRELAEETGIDHGPDQLRLWAIKTGGSHNDIGLFYLAPALPADRIATTFDAHLRHHTDPELVALHLTTGPAPGPDLPDAARADYLNTLLNTWTPHRDGGP
jgi:8-oxo-dGTP pyrophosphatase MutT (NUDIX family)